MKDLLQKSYWKWILLLNIKIFKLVNNFVSDKDFQKF